MFARIQVLFFIFRVLDVMNTAILQYLVVSFAKSQKTQGLPKKPLGTLRETMTTITKMMMTMKTTKKDQETTICCLKTLNFKF